MNIFRKIFNAIFKSPNNKQNSHENDYAKTANITIKAKKVTLNSEIISALDDEFFAIDVETTGLYSFSDRIVELGIVRYKNKQVVDTFDILINPGFGMPDAASRVNNITDYMLKDAPNESVAIMKACMFMQDAIKGNSFLCAHNADFDIDFLSEALKRNGISAKLIYLDTLKESKLLISSNNYKLGTLSTHFNIVNDTPHRSIGDAKACGDILIKLMDVYKEKEKEEQECEKKKEELNAKTMPSDDELKVCAVIYNIIRKNGEDTELLRFHKDSGKYIVVSWGFTILKFKFAKKGKYMLIEIEDATNIVLPKEKATQSEVGGKYERVFFNSYEDILKFEDYILKRYAECKSGYERYDDWISYSTHEKNEKLYYSMGCILTEETVSRYLDKIKNTTSSEDIDIKLNEPKEIDVNSIDIHPNHNRVALSMIKNYNNSDKGFEEGFPFWEKGDLLRKEGKIIEAIEMFDIARYNGYDAPSLYMSYALAYRKLKDYENEIAILNEGIERYSPTSSNYTSVISKYKIRRNKAFQLLAKKKKERLD